MTFPLQQVLNQLESRLQEAGIKPTANRILLLRTLDDAATPLTLTQLETLLDTVDKSSIYRNLLLFHEHRLVHTIDTCDEGTKYALGHGHGDSGADDGHVHFHCEVCHRTFCFEDIPVPHQQLPSGFQADEYNFVISGICPDCSK